MSTREAERSYTIAEAAALKSVSPDFVRTAIKRTDRYALRAKKIGKGYRIDASALDQWWNEAIPDA